MSMSLRSLQPALIYEQVTQGLDTLSKFEEVCVGVTEDWGHIWVCRAQKRSQKNALLVEKYMI